MSDLINDAMRQEVSRLRAAGQNWTERRQAAQLRKGEILAAIDRVAAEDSWAGAVLGHHSPDEDRRYCGGCDMGCNCEAASWPCSTVELVLKHYGVDTTDMDLIQWRGVL